MGEVLREQREMLAPLLTLDQALARGEVLAADTTESTHVIRVGSWVYKFLRPRTDGCWEPFETSLRQLRFRAALSRQATEFNPLTLLEDDWLIVSPFVEGRDATNDECRELYRHFRDTGRGYIQDVCPKNVVVADARLTLVDFSIYEYDPDWCPSRCLESSNPGEIERCHFS
jgi:hypothetical protein